MQASAYFKEATLFCFQISHLDFKKTLVALRVNLQSINEIAHRPHRSLSPWGLHGTHQQLWNPIKWTLTYRTCYLPWWLACVTGGPSRHVLLRMPVSLLQETASHFPGDLMMSFWIPKRLLTSSQRKSPPGSVCLCKGRELTHCDLRLEECQVKTRIWEGLEGFPLGFF